MMWLYKIIRDGRVIRGYFGYISEITRLTQTVVSGLPKRRTKTRDKAVSTRLVTVGMITAKHPNLRAER